MSIALSYGHNIIRFGNVAISAGVVQPQPIPEGFTYETSSAITSAQYSVAGGFAKQWDHSYIKNLQNDEMYTRSAGTWPKNSDQLVIYAPSAGRYSLVWAYEDIAATSAYNPTGWSANDTRFNVPTITKIESFDFWHRYKFNAVTSQNIPFPALNSMPTYFSNGENVNTVDRLFYTNTPVTSNIIPTILALSAACPNLSNKKCFGGSGISSAPDYAAAKASYPEYFY